MLATGLLLALLQLPSADPADRAARLTLATLAHKRYDYPAARAHYDRLLETSPPDAIAVYARIGRADLDRIHASLDSAAAGFARAAAESEALGDRPAEAEALIGLGLALSRIEPIDSALRVLARAAGRAPPLDPALQARLRCTRGPLLVAAGRPGGKDDADQGLVLARRSGDDRLIGLCWHALGVWTFINVDDPDASAPPFDSAEVYQRRSGDVAGLAETLLWSGLDHFSFFDNVRAREDFLAALEQARRSGHRLVELGVHRALGSMAVRTGSFPAAATAFRTSAATARAMGDRPGVMRARASLASVDFALARFDEAGRGFREALAAAEHLGDATAILGARVALAWLAGVEGDWAAADRRLLEVFEYMRGHGLTGLIPGLRYSEGVIALKAGQLGRAEAILRAYLAATVPTEYVGRYQTRSRLALIALRRGDVSGALAELTAASDQLDSLRAALGDQELRTLAFQTSGGKLEEPDYGFAELVAGFVRAGRTDEAFRLAERRRARDLADRLLRAGPGAAPARASRPAGPMPTGQSAPVADDTTALLEYVAGTWGQPTTVFVLQQGRVAAHVLASMDSLRPRAERFLALLAAGQDEAALAKRLRRELLDPVLEALPAGVTRLVVVADDVLHRLPFDALRFDDGKPLVTRFAFTSTPSAAVAASLRRAAPRGIPTGVLALGDPVFVGGSESPETAEFRSAFAENGGLSRLPRSANEARLAGSYGINSRFLVGAEASESALKAALSEPTFGVLHLATHAIVDDWTATRTALALTPDSRDDGFLSPSEILRLAMPAELVVLSACRTAAGPVVTGEGVQGLTAPLLAAGARSVIATYWPIRDRSTLPFVRALYRSLAAGQPVGDALRSAKLDAIARGRPVAEWAAFLSVGDPMLRLELHAPPRRSPAVAAGVVVAAGVLFLAMRAARRRRLRE